MSEDHPPIVDGTVLFDRLTRGTRREPGSVPRRRATEWDAAVRKLRSAEAHIRTAMMGEPDETSEEVDDLCRRLRALGEEIEAERRRRYPVYKVR